MKLEMYTDNRLSFDYHVSQLCKIANKKSNVLYEIIRYIDTRRLLTNSLTT